MINKGKLTLKYSKDKKNKSTFFIKKKKNKSTYKINIKSFTTDKLDITFFDEVNTATYDFYESKISIDKFYYPLSKAVNYSLSTNGMGLENLVCNGEFNLKNKSVTFDNLKINNLNTKHFNIFPSNINKVINGEIKKFDGKIKFAPKYFFIKGNGNLSNISIKLNKSSNKLTIRNFKINISKFDTEEKILLIKSLKCKNINIPLDKNKTQLQDINFDLQEKETPYTIEINNEKTLNKFSTKDNFIIKNINGKYTSLKKNFSFIIKNTSILPNIHFTLSAPIDLNANGIIKFDNISILKKSSPILKIKSSTILIDKFKMHPLYINLSELKFDSPYFIITVNNDKKIYLLSIFPITLKNGQNNLMLNIDKTIFSNGHFLFTDYSLKKPFSTNITNIKGEINNFPSTVNATGNIVVNGTINNRNNISIKTTIEHEIGISGELISNDLSLPHFSPYSEKYISHIITSGNMDVKTSFDIKQKNLAIDFNLILKKFNLAKLENAKNIKKNLSKILPLIKDNEDKIKIKIPVKGKWGKPTVDFRSIFFNLFLDILDDSGKKTSTHTSKFTPDDTYDIIYFKPGTANFLLKKENPFSNELLDKIKNKNKHFLIEGYVDKQKDSQYLKKEILKEKIQAYTNDSTKKNDTEDFSILKKIYTSITTNPINQDITTDKLKNLILQNIKIEDSKYYSLSYARIKKIKNILTNNYYVDPKKINTAEESIFENPYLSGTTNNIAIIKSGTF